jgi:hypothetical protein
MFTNPRGQHRDNHPPDGLNAPIGVLLGDGLTRCKF